MPWFAMQEDDRVARGRNANRQFGKVHKFGKNTAIGTGFVEVWDGGTHTWPTAAAAVRVQAGGNAADDIAGAGARKIQIEGLDENWEEAEEVIELAGASQSSATTTTFIRVFRAYVSEVGTYHGSNTGAITIEDASANVHAYIEAGAGQTQMTQYTTPINTVSSMSRLAFTIDTGKTVDVRMYQNTNANDVSAGYTGAKRLIHEWVGLKDLVFRDRLDANITFNGATDIWFEAKVSVGTASISIDYDLVIYKGPQ